MTSQNFTSDDDQVRFSARRGIKPNLALRPSMIKRAFGFGPLFQALLVAGLVIVGSGSAKAVMSYTTYTPPIANLNDLDHHAAYMWTIDGIATQPTYTSASLTIRNINNWDLNANILFIHLFDTAKLSSFSSTPAVTVVGSGNNILTSFDDAAGSPVTDLNDAFKSSNLSTTPLEYPYEKSNILLGTYVDGKFSETVSTAGYSIIGGSTTTTSNPNKVININTYNGVYTDDGAGADTQGVTTIPKVGSTFYAPVNGNNYAYDITFTFTQFQLDTLNAYIDKNNVTNGTGSVSFGFDSDCHFFNSGIEFKLGYSPDSLTPVPEGSALLPLIGVLGLVGGSRYMRRRSHVEA